ncbi:MAG: DUF2520 domain-containing protein [Winogradskyella sp.]|nr:DUF2520 domain-containing protein [Winogradskyella sp.]
MISVVILGAGNVASHLFRAFNASSSITVKQWYNRSSENMKRFAGTVPTTTDLSQLVEADLYILAVSDRSIKPLSEKLPFTDRLIAHTSGSMSIHELVKKNERAVFYPLQTFSTDADVDFKNVPICAEVLNKEHLNTLRAIAKAIESPFYRISTDQRQTLHLAAVFANNFVNQLYRVAHEICESKHIEFEILKPLIDETAHKLKDMSPYMAQTGPAKRNDKVTIKKHLKLLQNKNHKELYKLLTASIQKTHG